MAKITEEMVVDAMHDVAPKIEEMTGWQVPLSKINVYILDREQAFEYNEKPFFRKLGIEPREPEKSEHWYQAAFIPLIHNILIIRNNIGRFNQEGLTSVVGHELMHACQFMLHPEFENDLIKWYVKALTESYGREIRQRKSPDLEFAERYLDVIPILTEGDAYLVQEQLERRYYPNVEIKMSLELRIKEKLRPKETLAKDAYDNQVDNGLLFVEDIMIKSGREGVNNLYKLNNFTLVHMVESWQEKMEDIRREYARIINQRKR